LTQGPEQDFARDLLDKIDKGWSALLRFTERFYTKLTVVAKILAKTAWQLVGRCWGAVFEEMRPFRACLKEIWDTKSAETTAVNIEIEAAADGETTTEAGIEIETVNPYEEVEMQC
jgi:hypothetical protein